MCDRFSGKVMRWRDGRLESVSQPRGQQKSGPLYCSSREAATQESPARPCRVAKVEQSRVPEGRHSSCDTVSTRPSGTRWPGGAPGAPPASLKETILYAEEYSHGTSS